MEFTVGLVSHRSKECSLVHPFLLYFLFFLQDIPLRVVDNTSHKKNQATDDVVALDSNPIVASEEVKWPDIIL